MHYVCKSCGGVSKEAKTCSTEGCAMKGQPLVECDCGNENHGKEESEKVTS